MRARWASRGPLPWPGFVTVWRSAFVIAILLVSGGLAVTIDTSQGPFVILATTTSTRDSGLLDYLLPSFSQDTGTGIRYVAVGTGLALDMGRRGDADVVLVHAPPSEAVFMDEGHGLCRSPVMRNQFIVVGPPSDPAGVRNLENATVAFARIRAQQALFVSRGDNSGTHQMEKAIWSWVGYTPDPLRDPWYREAGQGMGATLKLVSELGAYTLTDDGTFLVLRAGLELDVHITNDPPLQNFYSVIPVNSERHPAVMKDGALAFARWIVSARGQALIGNYTIAGEQPFHPMGEDRC